MFELNVKPINTSLDKRLMKGICDEIGRRLEADITLHAAMDDPFLRVPRDNLRIDPELEDFVQAHPVLWEALVLKYLNSQMDGSTVVITDDMIISAEAPVYGRTHYSGTGSLWDNNVMAHAFVSTLLPRFYREDMRYTLKRVMIHEIGHILGIEGHCTNRVGEDYCIMAPGEFIKEHEEMASLARNDSGLDFCTSCSRTIDAYK